MQSSILVHGSDQTVHFAAAELAKYLRLMSREPVCCEVRRAEEDPGTGIALGLFSDFGLQPSAVTAEGVPGTDSIHVDIRDGAGVIAGVNPRSVLLAVYRCLHELGCRWVRPGTEGEFVPRVDISHVSVQMDETASLHHRVICIEGAVSVENVLEIVDWAPKVGFSGYFMQFPDGYAFFDRWYSHAGAPDGEAEPFSVETAREFTIRVEEALRVRNLEYHAVGHGWHCRAIGVNVSHWNPVHAPPSAETTAMLAEFEGRRDYRWDRPMITSLCFSQADVRRRMVEQVVTYSVQHPEVDYLHVWLDDGMGNKCDCEECRKSTPSDLYVQLLQEIDAALTRVGSEMRIVFIGYTDLLWPPGEKAAPLRPERFTFVYANSRGSFPEALDHCYAEPPAMPAYAYRDAGIRHDAQLFASALKGWQACFSGDGMLFEYYMCRIMFDQVPAARRIHDDVRRLKTIGLNGIVSCQLQRVFLPTGLGTYMLGQALWHSGIDCEETINDYYAAAFGAESALAKEFIKLTVEEMGKSVSIKGSVTVAPNAAVHLDKLAALLAEFTVVCDRNLYSDIPCQARSWYNLRWYMRIVARLLTVYRCLADGDSRAALEQWKETKAYLFAHERNFQPFLDLWSLCRQYDRALLAEG